MTNISDDANREEGTSVAPSTLRKYGMIVATAVVAAAALTAVGGAVILLTSAIRTYLVEAAPITPLAYTGSVFLFIDTTESESGPVRERVCEVAKNKVIVRLSPGTFCGGYAIGAEPAFDEVAGRIFGDSDAPGPKIRLGLQGDGARSPGLNAELAGQTALLRSMSQEWSRRIDDLRPPRNRCCSAYLAALSYLEKRLGNGSLPSPVTVVIIGDLKEEPTPEPFAAPPAEGPERRVYDGVRVLLVRPYSASGPHSRVQIDDYWADYFHQRGATPQIYDLNGFPGIEAQ